MTAQGEKLGRYGFIVDRNANKIQIKKAVEQMYNVTVSDVNTMVMYGKKSTRNTTAGQVTGYKNKFKKAIITLKTGDVIDFYSSI